MLLSKPPLFYSGGLYFFAEKDIYNCGISKKDIEKNILV